MQHICETFAEHIPLEIRSIIVRNYIEIATVSVAAATLVQLHSDYIHVKNSIMSDSKFWKNRMSSSMEELAHMLMTGYIHLIPSCLRYYSIRNSMMSENDKVIFNRALNFYFMRPRIITSIFIYVHGEFKYSEGGKCWLDECDEDKLMLIVRFCVLPSSTIRQLLNVGIKKKYMRVCNWCAAGNNRLYLAKRAIELRDDKLFSIAASSEHDLIHLAIRGNNLPVLRKVLDLASTADVHTCLSSPKIYSLNIVEGIALCTYLILSQVPKHEEIKLEQTRSELLKSLLGTGLYHMALDKMVKALIE